MNPSIAGPRIGYRSTLEASPESGVSMARIWAKLARRKWLIFLSSIMMFGVFSAALWLVPKWYTTEAEIVVEQRPQGVDLAAVLSRIPTDSQAVLTEAEALRSRTLVQTVILDLDLLNNPEFNPKLIVDDGSLRSQLKVAKAAVVTFVENLLPARRETAGDPALNTATELFQKRLQVKPIGRSQVLRATFTSESPELSSKILNQLVTLYLRKQMENRVAVPTKVGDFLKIELQRLQVQVRDANDAVERYRNSAKLQQSIVQGREALLNTQELSQANADLIAVRAKRQEGNARLAEIRANPKAFPDVLASPAIQQLQHQISLLKENRAQLISSFGRSYPPLKQVESGIADAEGRLVREQDSIMRSVASDVIVLTEREKGLAQTVDDLKMQIQQAGTARVALAALEQEAEVDRSILSTFLTQYNQLTSQRALQIADSYILTKADIPTEPSFPPMLPFLGLAFMVSIGLSSGVALMLERTPKTIRNSQEVLPLLTARSLGVVPKLDNTRNLLTEVIDHPMSSFTESIRTTLSQFLPVRDEGRTILIASAEPREGRTSIAISLARLGALSGRRAILVDCDLRRPSVHAAFGSPAKPGLTDLLQNRLAPVQVIQRDPLSGLDFITGGQFAPNAANLLYLPEMGDLIVQLRKDYDLVILDSAPTSLVSDTSFLAQLADACLFVVRWNKTPWRLVREQMDELSHYNSNIAGVVLNQVDMRLHAKFYPGHIETVRTQAVAGPGA